MRAARGEGSVVKAGSGYRGYVTVDGKRKYTSVYKTKALAAQAKRELLSRRDDGVLTTGKAMTLETWLDRYLTSRESGSKPLAKSTMAGYRYSVSHYINPEIGAKRLDKLTIEDIEDLYNTLREKGIGESTIHQCHAVIRKSLKQASQRGHIGRNVAALVEAPSVGKADATALSDADTAAILAAAEGDVFEARWHLALSFGVRPSEAPAIEWGDIDFEASTLHVHQQLQQIKGMGLQLIDSSKTPKGDRKFVLPKYLLDMLIARRAAQLVEMVEEGDDWQAWEWEGQPRAFVFTQRNGQPIRPRLDTTNWKRLLGRAGVPHTRRYTARHTAASDMLADGVDLATVADTMGHASPAFTLSRYVHAIDERVTANADRLDARRQMTHPTDTVQDKVQQESAGPE